MSTKQLNLFGENGETGKNFSLEVQDDDKNLYTPFLPGVKTSECYPDVTTLEELATIAKTCDKCRLRGTCKQVVFGEGKSDSKILFIGEGPGKDEDALGRPFVGRAGQLLDKILNASELPRENVYISNVVKCRPPGNRLPNPDEVKECQKYLEAQIRIIKPEVIVCLGAKASQVIIDPQASISRIRGTWLTRHNIKIIATYHPAALLRNEGYKRPTWEDFKKIRDEYKKMV